MSKILIFLLFFPGVIFAQTAKQYFKLGNQKLDSAKYTDADNYYTKAIGLDSLYTDAYWNRGRVREKLKNIQGCLQDLNKVISLSPENVRAFTVRASVKYYQKDFNGAIGDYTSIISMDPNNAAAYAGRASAKMV